MSNPFKRIIDPRQQRTVHISDVSKEKLAHVVNEQAALIRKQNEHIKALTRVVLAITMEPEAFQFQHGIVTVDGAALQKVMQGAQLEIRPTADGVRLTAHAPQPMPELEIPSIVIPPGVH